MTKNSQHAKTKTAKVLDYLKTGHSLDFPKAIAMWGHIRLSDVIFRLRKKGVQIKTEIIESASSDVKFAIYRLPKYPTKDTKKGERVKVIADPGSPVDSYSGRVGRIVGFDWESHDGVTVLVRIPSSGDTWFMPEELEVI